MDHTESYGPIATARRAARARRSALLSIITPTLLVVAVFLALLGAMWSDHQSLVAGLIH